MASSMVHLGVDFGTSNTVAVLDTAGTVRPVLFDGHPVLPSGVCVDPAGGLLVGTDALHAARVTPECFEPYPKRRIDDGAVLLGSTEVPVTDLIAAVLRRVATAAGGGPWRVTLTCPAAWGGRRREDLRSAAGRAGLGHVEIVTEPVAAASYFTSERGTGGGLPVGAYMLVYDLGAGTFDASILRRTVHGFDEVASDGLTDGGGLDLDAAVVAHLHASYGGRDPAAWERLRGPRTAADRRASRALWDDVRTAKEMLSRASTTYIHLPLLELDVPLGREQFEALARPVLERTVATSVAAIREAGIAPEALAAVCMVGGASRVPLIATLLHRALKIAPRVVEQPELAVAYGSLTATEPPAVQDTPAPRTGAAWAAPARVLPVVVPESGATPGQAAGRSRRRPRIVAAGTGIAAVAVVAAVAILLSQRERPTDDRSAGNPASTGPATTVASASPSPDPSQSTADGPQWFDASVFMQIKDGGKDADGQLWLNVRPAEKEELGESFRTLPGSGPYTRVVIAASARIIQLDDVIRTPIEFFRDLRERASDELVEGFDVKFDPSGQVFQVDWRYVSG